MTAPPLVQHPNSTEARTAHTNHKYEERYLAFTDILGFGAIVKKSETDDAVVSQVYSALASIGGKAVDARSLEFGVEATSFSDTVVLSVPVTTDGLFHLMELVHQLSTTLLSMNMLFRGAIVRGDVLHTSNLIFGPALVSAYKLETNKSFHPRIILDKSVHEDAAQGATAGSKKVQFDKYIVKDSHDVPYLNPFAQWHSQQESWSADDLGKLIQLQGIVAEGLIENADDPPVGEKYRWLARKLDAFVSAKHLTEKMGLIEVD